MLLAPVLTGDIVGRDKMAHGVGVLFALKSLPLTVGPILAGKWDTVKTAMVKWIWTDQNMMPSQLKV